MERLEAMVVHRDHHVRFLVCHLDGLSHHQGCGSEDHIAGNDGHIGIRCRGKRREQARERTAEIVGIAHQRDVQIRELLGQKAQVLRLVRGDDELVGHR